MDRLVYRLASSPLRLTSRLACFAVVVAGLAFACAASAQRTVGDEHANKGSGNPADGMTTNIPGELSGVHLVSPVANGQWTMPAGDYGNTRYSPLSQINTTNVQNLHVIDTMSTGIPHGHEGGPLVVGSTLYIVTPGLPVP